MDSTAYVAQLRGGRAPSDALLHYLLVGSRVGLRPTPTFDPAYYRRANPDVSIDGYEPYAHFLAFGAREGRAPSAENAATGADSVPSVERIVAARRKSPASPEVDVVVPVYGARGLTLAAIDSVLSAPVRAAFECVVVDDASPDPDLSRELVRLADVGLITLLRNETNQGFVRSVNRGMAEHPDRDVVLLNSDTRVSGDWLDRLLAALRSAPNVATATPLSNSATILSYPIRLRDNSTITPAEAAAIDVACSEIASKPIEIPTGVGFCMAIARSCLERIGAFDAERFPRGYGEENDFCRRAAAGGWVNLAVPSAYVWHRGGASFGDDREELIGAAQEKLHRLHPDYRDTIRRFIAVDPIAPVRAAIDAARIRGTCAQPSTLDATLAERAGSPRSMLRLVRDVGRHGDKVRIVADDGLPTPNLPRLGIDTPVQELRRLLQDLAVGEIVGPNVDDDRHGVIVAHLLEAGRASGIRIVQMPA